MNFNGLSASSSTIETFIACMPPTGFFYPYKIKSTKTSITIGWDAPLSDGGCAITKYEVYMDDGNGGSITTVTNPNLDPTIRQATITTFPASKEGEDFRF